MDKLLVIGVETLAGGNLALSLSDRFEVIGVSQTTGFEFDGCRMLHVASDEIDDLAEIVLAERPQWVMYCGPTSIAGWDEHGAIDASLEAVRAKTVEQAAGECGSRMMLISTDAVFDGPRLFHRETFPTASNPVALAARQVEQALTANDTLILRTHLFGWSPGGKSYVERMWNVLADGGQPKVSGTNYATPMLASDAAEFAWQAYRRKLSGLFHLGGAERISQWQFAVALATGCGVTVNELRPSAGATVVKSTAAGEETSLDSRRFQRAVSTPLPMTHEAVRRFIAQSDNGYRQRLQSGVATKLPELSAA